MTSCECNSSANPSSTSNAQQYIAGGAAAHVEHSTRRVLNIIQHTGGAAQLRRGKTHPIFTTPPARTTFNAIKINACKPKLLRSKKQPFTSH